MALSHERLRVYQAAQELERRGQSLADRAARRRPDLADQLRRALSSIGRNISEGANDPAPGSKARYYQIARGSAGEVGAVLDSMVISGIATREKVSQLKGLVEVIVRMLTQLIRSLDGGRSIPEPKRSQET